jgi:hypothetical protein
LIVSEAIQLDITSGTTADELWDVIQAGITICPVHSQST